MLSYLTCVILIASILGLYFAIHDTKQNKEIQLINNKHFI